jgi:hypothetical protein
LHARAGRRRDRGARRALRGHRHPVVCVVLGCAVYLPRRPLQAAVVEARECKQHRLGVGARYEARCRRNWRNGDRIDRGDERG